MRKILVTLAVVIAGCGGGSNNGDNQTPTVATPVISPAGGTFSTTQTATITCATAGATIRYTTDGSAPTGSSPAYAAGIPVTTTNTTIRAFAQAAGQTDSAVASATFVLQAATPTFSPGAGTYATPQSVTLASATPTAVIRYTTDGSPPTASSPTYTVPIPVSTAGTTTIRAQASRTGFADSAVASATYVINPEAVPTATPTFSPVAGTYTSAQNVSISCATAGATIYYTTNGADPTTASAVYAAPFLVPATTTVKAMAVAPGFTQSAVGSAAYVINLPQPTATPTFSPVAGTYASTQNVTISCATAGATIYYTTNGADPTTSSTVYTTPVAVSSNTTLKAIAVAPGFTQSAVGSAAYVIGLPQTTATPTFSPVAGTYTSTQNVTISCATAGATIYYTTNGADPTTASAVYSVPIAVSTTTTIKALATAPGFAPSAITTGAYTISAGTDFGTLCQAVQTKMRDLFASCLKYNPALLAAPGPFGDPATLNCSDIAREIAAGLIAYDPLQGSACVAAFQTLSCTGIFGLDFAMPPACDAALQGQVANGGTCYSDANCAAGYCTADWTSACPGTCQPLVALDGDCSSAPCAAGLACDLSFLCKAAGKLGDPCPCESGLWCDPLANTCKTPQTSGACDQGNLDQCAVGTVCVGTPQSTCQPLVGAGDPCTPGPSVSACGFGYECLGSPVSTCASWPVPPEPCDFATPFCIGGYCDFLAGTCQAYKAVGAACTDSFECASLQCSGTPAVCQPLTCAAP